MVAYGLFEVRRGREEVEEGFSGEVGPDFRLDLGGDRHRAVKHREVLAHDSAAAHEGVVDVELEDDREVVRVLEVVARPLDLVQLLELILILQQLLLERVALLEDSRPVVLNPRRRELNALVQVVIDHPELVLLEVLVSLLRRVRDLARHRVSDRERVRV